MDDTAAVLAANRAFYQAFETLELREMEKMWLQESYIKCVHPGWPLLCGWGPVMASWERIFTNTESMRFNLSDVRVEVLGDLGLGGVDRKPRIERTGWRLPLPGIEHQCL